MDDVVAQKALLRAHLSDARREQAKKATDLTGLAWQLASLVQALRAKTVAAYLPFGDEPNIGNFLFAAPVLGLELIMPVSRTDGTLDWVIWTGDKAPGIFGFEEPVGEPTELSRAEVILVPALAIDHRGNRLGKGKGYYDRALAEVSDTQYLVGVIYDSEFLESLPAEPHDQPVEIAVTPNARYFLPV